MNNNYDSKLKELMNVVLFAFSVIGAIVVLAYIYKDIHEFDVIPMEFFKQVIIYVAFFALAIIICFTDIIPINISQGTKLIATIIAFYILTMNYLSHCPINPTGSIERFITCTVWYFFVVGCVIVSWHIYETTTSNKYNKYLKEYQNLKK
ncbi:Uncharacterised protein [[Clostridium] sordellii]|uniref:hypothetical protein n=1 Tax=Paraclostridium sordellii TaxID=1505 RepID=UPI0005DDE797|nr:hypothetical protein [Paeniclostridium sordellii]CEQ24500.1 Uncharacterised protein [[Clostridium] sordellii] [Paeniclostridium sordellii]